MVDRPSSPAFSVRPVSAVNANSIITQACLGQDLEDWESAKKEFIKRLDDILRDCQSVGLSEMSQQIASFSAPPHTVQRLAELLEDPQKWYRSSAKYIRALVRVLSVTSTSADFSNEKESSAVASEDSLLVPIPWLRSEDFDDVEVTRMPNGVHISMASTLPDHDSYAATMSTMTGSAPIDAADYGPQSEQVQGVIASNVQAHEEETKAHTVGISNGVLAEVHRPSHEAESGQGSNRDGENADLPMNDTS